MHMYVQVIMIMQEPCFVLCLKLMHFSPITQIDSLIANIYVLCSCAGAHLCTGLEQIEQGKFESARQFALRQ